MSVPTGRVARAAAERAVTYVESGMRLGLGTGSTAKHVLDVLSEKLRDGTLRDIGGVPTSRATADYARSLGIPLLDLDDVLDHGVEFTAGGAAAHVTK